MQLTALPNEEAFGSFIQKRGLSGISLADNAFSHPTLLGYSDQGVDTCRALGSRNRKQWDRCLTSGQTNPITSPWFVLVCDILHLHDIANSQPEAGCDVGGITNQIAPQLQKG